LSAPPVVLTPDQATDAYRQAAKATLPPDRSEPAEAIVWHDAGAELLLYPGRASLAVETGLLLATIPIFTEQTGSADVVVPFAVGSADTNAGLAMATRSRPSGPDAVLDRWSDPLVNAAWQALLVVAIDAVAPARPAALAAERGMLMVQRGTAAESVS
jgi:hypothetical protein